VVAGADVDRIRSDARASGLAERVVAVPHRPATELFGAADLLVQPTYRDPCSLATLEALASGVPVLTTTANGAADALTRPEAGETLAVGDPIALADALRRWLAIVIAPPSRAEVAAAARACTTDRDAPTWLDGMVASLEEAATR
jgi:UDP-glucose:(heptosyl)LPS alpha-1,3-glucosyltransferase